MNKKQPPTSLRLHPAIKDALQKESENTSKSINALVNEILKKSIIKK